MPKVSPTTQRASPKLEMPIPPAHETAPTSKRHACKPDSGGQPHSATPTTPDPVAEYEALAEEYEQLLQERNRLRQESKQLLQERTRLTEEGNSLGAEFVAESD
jgi:hypothetical protein